MLVTGAHPWGLAEPQVRGLVGAREHHHVRDAEGACDVHKVLHNVVAADPHALGRERLHDVSEIFLQVLQQGPLLAKCKHKALGRGVLLLILGLRPTAALLPLLQQKPA